MYIRACWINSVETRIIIACEIQFPLEVDDPNSFLG